MHTNILLLIFSYLIGSIPSGLIFAKILNKGDIRKSGSGNIGATNALRIGGKLLGALTLAFDLFKGLAVIIISKSLDQQYIGIYGFICVLGHIFPIWLKFKGGKGVATTFGVMLGMHPLMGIIMIIVWIIIFNAFNISSIASLFCTIIPITVILSEANYSLDSIFMILCLVLIVYKHKDNIIRLYKGEESKISL